MENEVQARALIFDLQRFSIHDGPGIRTTVFFKGCPLKCAWCQNPESIKPRIEMSFDAGQCRKTGDCVRQCPRGAILPTGERFVREKCDACGVCATACAYGAWQQVGRAAPVDEIVAEVLRDRSYFAVSNGGVTFSGGEPTLQMASMAFMARSLHEHGVSVGLQTCGLFSWEAFAPHVSLFSFIHFDVKLVDTNDHQRWTGASNATILANARHLTSIHAPLLFRMPVIPGITDTEVNLEQVAQFLLSLGAKEIHLLRHHIMGQGKRLRLGESLPEALPRDLGEEPLVHAASTLTQFGLQVTT
jgi:pyruvate formate lyase activating enzyme